MKRKRVLILAQHFGLLAEQADVLQQQVAEIGGVEHFQPPLDTPCRVSAPCRWRRRRLRPPAPARASARDSSSRRSAWPSTRAGQRFSSMFSASSSCLSSRIWSSTSRMVKSGFSPTSSAWRRRISHPDRVERAEPGHALDHVADDLADAMLHLARRLVGEGDGEDFARAGAAEAENMGDAHGEHASLAGAGAGQHQHRAVERLDREPLLRIEPGEIRRARRRRRARARQCRRAREAAARAGGSASRGQPRGEIPLILTGRTWHLDVAFTRWKRGLDGLVR